MAAAVLEQIRQEFGRPISDRGMLAKIRSSSDVDRQPRHATDAIQRTERVARSCQTVQLRQLLRSPTLRYRELSSNATGPDPPLLLHRQHTADEEQPARLDRWHIGAERLGWIGQNQIQFLRAFLECHCTPPSSDGAMRRAWRSAEPGVQGSPTKR